MNKMKKDNLPESELRTKRKSNYDIQQTVLKQNLSEMIKQFKVTKSVFREAKLKVAINTDFHDRIVRTEKSIEKVKLLKVKSRNTYFGDLIQ